MGQPQRRSSTSLTHSLTVRLVSELWAVCVVQMRSVELFQKRRWAIDGQIKTSYEEFTPDQGSRVSGPTFRCLARTILHPTQLSYITRILRTPRRHLSGIADVNISTTRAGWLAVDSITPILEGTRYCSRQLSMAAERTAELVIDSVIYGSSSSTITLLPSTTKGYLSTPVTCQLSILSNRFMVV